MFTNNQVSFVSGGSGGGGGPPSGSGVSGKSSSGIRQSSPSYHHHLGGYAYGQQGNHYPHHQVSCLSNNKLILHLKILIYRVINI